VTAKVASPLGAITLSPFSDDGAKLPATITTADAPTDVFSIDAKTGAVEPLRKDARPGLDKLAPIESSIGRSFRIGMTREEFFFACDELPDPIKLSLPTNDMSVVAIHTDEGAKVLFFLSDERGLFYAEQDGGTFME
jgi:hypothetical protein